MDRGKTYKEAFMGGPTSSSTQERGGVGMDQASNKSHASHEAGEGRQGSRLKNGFLAKAKENPRYRITSPQIRDYIQFMKDHAIICKFMGICPSKKL
jgi:hypothetical protein